MIIADSFSLWSEKLYAELQNLDELKAVYDWIGLTVSGIDSKLVCIVVQNDEISNKGIVGGFYGLSSKWLLRLIDILGVNPIGRAYEKTEEGEKYFYTEKAPREFKGGLYELADGQVPKWVALSVERVFSIHQIFTIALNYEDVQLGTLLLFPRQELSAAQWEALGKMGAAASRRLLEIRNVKLGFATLDNWAKSLISQINHEIRTPLNGILGLMNEVVPCGSSDTPSEIIDDLHDCANQLQRTVENWILISDFNSKRVSFQFERISIHEVCERILQIIESFKIKYSQRLIVSETAVCGEPQFVIADWKFLETAVVELIDNALKFSRNEVRIRVSYEGKYLVFEVEDFGVGVSENQLNEIFKPFHLYRQKDRIYRGTGVGLSIVKNIADAHHFELILVRTSPSGSVFALKMPVIEGYP